MKGLQTLADLCLAMFYIFSSFLSSFPAHSSEWLYLVNGKKIVEMEVLNHAVIYIFRIQQFYIFWQLCELNLWEKAWMIETFLNEQ